MTTQELIQKQIKFEDLLAKTKRDNIDIFINNIRSSGFYDAPASTKYHGAYKGGLIEHSLNVYLQAHYLADIQRKLYPQISDKLKEDSIIIASLLHDFCKRDCYKQVKKWKKNENDKWVQYDTYEHTYENTLPLGHGEKSVIDIIRMGITLTDDECLAIRWHMGAFDLSEYTESKTSFSTATNISPLTSIISCADWLACRITENDLLVNK